MSRTFITITTINVPTFMDGICQNLNDHRHTDVNILVIGDKKTPDATRTYCEATAQKYGVAIEYLGIEDQLQALAKYPELLELFPYNTPDRVILGGMLSYLRGADRLIAIDDDNFTMDNDFLGFHGVTGTEAEVDLVENELQWFNVHSALIEANNIPFYPRGYPWQQRKPESSLKTLSRRKVKVIASQGLVLEDPDIDAISRLFWPIRATGMRTDLPPQFGLAPGTWSPFNYQNTCLAREIIPLYYRPISTMRNADIWTAYLINRLGLHFGDVICFGQPLVKQIRNVHNLWDDLDVELVCNRATDDLITILRGMELTQGTYFGALKELLAKGRAALDAMPSVRPAEREMIVQFFAEYTRWCAVVEPML